MSQIKHNDINFKFKYNDDVVKNVLNISPGSLKKIVSEFDKPKKKRFHLKNSEIYRNIPVLIVSYRRYSSDISASGCNFVEHKGESSYAPYPLTYTNIHFYSQWISRITVSGKDRQDISQIYSKLSYLNPLFKYGVIKKSHQDNEKALLSYLYHKSNLELSSSSSYHSNDNCLVEQKNGDKLRNIAGYFRYDTDFEVSLLNKIWEISDLIDNSFIPSYKIISRLKNEKGRTIKKIYDVPKTPYQRLMDSSDMPDELKKEIEMIFKSLNLVELKKKQSELLSELFEYKKDKKNLYKIDENVICP